MSNSDYAAFLDYFLPDYAQEIASNYARSDDEARRQAQAEIAHSLPDGPQTEGHRLCTIVESAPQPTCIGYIWYRPDAKTKSVFIYDFCILPDHRGNGRGKAALQALEIELAHQGYGEIRLRVAADNPRAQHIYQAGGFRVTGMNMAKRINSGSNNT
ncbi:MAG TPA: GNAT family N-acetyltransferase [Rhizobium sp.]|nr:GNAT family N-acetyltransferase [Rhizobium sp.]